MLNKVELVYDPDCPNVEAAREQLRKAFATVGAEPEWQEWDRGCPESPPHVKQYGSPTILVDGKDVSGDGSEAESNCCRVYAGPDGRMEGVPPVAAISNALRSSQ